MSVAGPVFDVEVRLVPAVVPNGLDQLPGDDAYFTSRWNPGLSRYVEPVQTNQNYSLEVWVSDNNAGNTPNTGIVSAYFDVAWDNGTITDALSLGYHPEFNVLREGTINNPLNNVRNFGGTHLGQPILGIEPGFVRLGSINLDHTGDGLVLFDGTIGQGEVGVLNRTVGNVLIVGAAVPEPTSLALFVLGTLAFLRRRQLAATS